MVPAALVVLAASLAPVLPLAGQQEDRFDEARRGMVRDQIASDRRGADAIRDTAVLRAMLTVPRHEFVLPELIRQAYWDGPLPIGHGQTISQPYIVALMTELLEPKPGHRALEIGTGSGYQAAVLAQVVDSVYTLEIIEELARSAKARLARLGYESVTVRHGDGYFGWPEFAPFDVIIVTAAATHIPPPLVEQLAPGGRMVIPVGPPLRVQQLMFLEKRMDGSVVQRAVLPVAFVPFRRGG